VSVERNPLEQVPRLVPKEGAHTKAHCFRYGTCTPHEHT
jgi:hypothetical protein